MKYICSWSGGKDSTATIILAHEHNEPIDEIIFSEVMFDEGISGELPEHIDFIKNKAIPIFESWGYKVTILHSDRTYMDCFNHIVQKSKVEERNGKKAGFPMSGKCVINRDCKVGIIKKYLKQVGDKTEYIGIAIDEPKRLAKLQGDRISLLAKYNMTEQDAYDLCEKYDLLSPIYSFAPRGGCWFCPNARYNELKRLRYGHRDLWELLLALEDEPDKIGEIWNSLTGRSMKDNEEMFRLEEMQVTIDDLLEGEENE